MRFRHAELVLRRILVPMRLALHTAVLLLLLRSPAVAQTADPAAAPNNPATTAPAAHTGSYSVQNGELIVAPGLRIPNGNVPWVLDTVNGKQVLVPVHHAALAHGASVLDGGSSKTPLRSTTPVFFIHTSDRTENTGDAGRGSPTGWALLAAQVDGASRKIARPKFSDVNGATVCSGPFVCTTAESLPDGWLRIVPSAALAAGEYVLLPVPRTPVATGNEVVYDFTVDGASAKSKDEVSPGQNLDSAKHKRR